MNRVGELQCELCDDYYPADEVIDGVCSECRNARINPADWLLAELAADDTY